MLGKGENRKGENRKGEDRVEKPLTQPVQGVCWRKETGKMLTSFRSYGGGRGGETDESLASGQGVINPRRFRTLKRSQTPQTYKEGVENEAAMSIPLAMQQAVSDWL